MTETWKPVRNYEGYYEVSNFGRVRRIKAATNTAVGKVLSLKPPTRNYDYIRLQLCKNNEKRSFGVHFLVAEAFHGKRPRNKFPNHKDLDKTNNHADNLEWLTRRQNQMHAIENNRRPGKRLAGHLNGRAKLTQDQVNEIIAQRGRIGQRVLAALCGVCRSTIQFIHQGKHWRMPEDLRVREFPGR